MTTIINIEQWFKCAVAAAALAVSTGALVLPASAADKPSLEARVRKLDDEAQIRHLLVEYGHALDTRDFARYSQLFAKDGTWTG
ncbi:MAG TPA: nuclear transport factor 2 family protein, partial [Steroidobacteraceae bacterium]